MRHLLVSHLLVSIALWGQAALWGLVASGCVAPPPPSELAADAARDLNLAARFGQLGAAASHTADGARESFLERRAQWGKYLRIVDTELAGFEMDTHDNAKIYVDVTWLRADELTVRSTRIAQFWRDHRVGGWLLVREKRVAGDIGLFGEPVQRSATRAKDVHFPTTTIRE